MKKLVYFIIALLCVPSLSGATGVLERAANPQQEVWTFSQSAIPFIKASSGSIANNCAITAMTALPRTFSGGAYIYLPAASIQTVASGGSDVPAVAGWYWFVGSSTTAGTCYNQTYSNNKLPNGTPLIPPTNTAFATTGPGAYVGATGAVTSVSLTLPGGSMGKNGHVLYAVGYSNNNSAGTKTTNVRFNGSSIASLANSTNTSLHHTGYVYNRGVTNLQGSGHSSAHSGGSGYGTMTAADFTHDTTGAVSMAFDVNCNTATDHHIVEMYSIQIRTVN